MKKEYEKVIAIKEMACGNETVGSMWLETKSFNRNTPVCEIVDWASNAKGKLIITIDKATEE